MRPVKLVMSAFGPFAGREEVDFAALGRRGVFLITGSTGAGKTSIFDGITFALYGRTSGSDRENSGLRSDYADSKAATYVELEFEHRNELYKIRRVPPYMRRKKNGKGMTEEKSSAELRYPDGRTVHDVQNVTGAVINLLGIDYDQYKQLVMLAQNEFRELLMVEGEKRIEIFRRVFDTKKYLDIQETLKRKNSECAETLETWRVKLMENFRGISTDRQEDAEEIEEMVSKNNIYPSERLMLSLKNGQKLLSEKIERSAAELNDINGTITVFAAEIERGNTKNENIRRLAEAKRSYDALMADRAEAEILEAKLALIAKARPVISVSRHEDMVKRDLSAVLERKNSSRLEELGKAFESARIRYESIRAQEGTIKELEDKIRELKAALEKWTEIKKKDDEIEKLKLEAAKRRVLLDNAYSELKEREAAADEIVKMSAFIDSEAKALHECEIEGKENRQKAETLSRLADSINKKGGCEKELGSVKERYIEEEKLYIKHTSAYMEAERLYLAGQAGILAEGLGEGEMCPVCGSRQHPKKAVRADHVPDDAEMKRLKKTQDSAREALTELGGEASRLRGVIEQLEREIKAAAESAGMEDADLPKAKAELSKVSMRLAELRAEYNRHKANADKRASVSEQAEKLRIELETRRLDISQKEREAEKWRTLLEQAESTAEKLRQEAEPEEDTLKKLASAENSYMMLSMELEHASELFHTSEVKYNSAKSAEAELDRSVEAKQAYLAGIAEEKSKLLKASGIDEEMLADITEESKHENEWNDSLKKYNTKKLELEVALNKLTAEAGDCVECDTEAFSTAMAEAEARRNALLDMLGRNRLIYEKNEEALSRISSIYKTIEKQTSEYNMINELNRLANGMLSGKQRIKLEQYVQAMYFNEVLDAANIRLDSMSFGQYELLRREGTGEKRITGLELDVFDNYTGRSRSVKSLSGGESFKAALALAFGLSDVIQSRSGGLQIDTLFIDEGFGTLDDESLASVMRTLDGLSGGDRLIGIISHVPQLKEQIEKKIIVKKTKTGSVIIR